MCVCVHRKEPYGTIPVNLRTYLGTCTYHRGIYRLTIHVHAPTYLLALHDFRPLFNSPKIFNLLSQTYAFYLKHCSLNARSFRWTRGALSDPSLYHPWQKVLSLKFLFTTINVLHSLSKIYKGDFS